MFSTRPNSKNKYSALIPRLLAALSPLRQFTIQGRSMVPTLQPGNRVLVNRIAYLFHKPQKGDIVVVRKPREKTYIIKRISSVRGDTYFVTGDNADESTDSRDFGMINRRDIVGKVFYKR